MSTKPGTTIMLIGVIFWIIHNFIFGWNQHPQSNIEIQIESYYVLVLRVGIFLYLLPLANLYEYQLKKMNDEKENN